MLRLGFNAQLFQFLGQLGDETGRKRREVQQAGRIGPHWRIGILTDHLHEASLMATHVSSL